MDMCLYQFCSCRMEVGALRRALCAETIQFVQVLNRLHSFIALVIKRNEGEIMGYAMKEFYQSMQRLADDNLGALCGRCLMRIPGHFRFWLVLRIED